MPTRHEVLGTPLKGPFPGGIRTAIFGMGCFWGAERMFWQAEGVYTTAVGYAGGFTPNPTYEEVCSGRTGHAEAVLVVFDASRTSYEEMLKIFWEGHDPTQGMRQGNDVGTQYRSLHPVATARPSCRPPRPRERPTRSAHRGRHGHDHHRVRRRRPEHPFYYAEAYHQQYLAEEPRRLLRARRHRRVLPDRGGHLDGHRRGRRAGRIVVRRAAGGEPPGCRR